MSSFPCVTLENKKKKKNSILLEENVKNRLHHLHFRILITNQIEVTDT